VNNEQMLKYDADAKDLETQLDELRAEMRDPEQELLSIEQFLNLAKNAGSKVKAADEVGKDHIARIIFLNLVVDDEKVVSYKMTKAFSKLEKAQNVLNGRRAESLNEPILQTLHSLLLGFSGIKDRLERLHMSLDDIAYSEKASKMQFLL
jgi:hypothetical protein